MGTMSGVNPEQVNFVVGFDLGHGETALMVVNLKSEHVNDRASKVEVDGKSNFITALAYHPQYGILIGRDALTTDGVDKSWICFKQRPTDHNGNREVIRTYAQYIHERLLKSHYGFTADNTSFYVGCPTDWAQDRNLLTEYQSIFTSAGFHQVTVVAESRGALMNGVESGDILATTGDLKGRALIIDLGSSTADFTLIDLQQRKAQPFDFGHDLGSSLIDKLIFRKVLQEHKRKDELIAIFLEHPTIRNKCELACRDAKEAWFNNHKSTPRESVEIILDDLYFTVRLDEMGMEQLLQQKLSVLDDTRQLFASGLPPLSQSAWQGVFEALLDRVQQSSGEPDIILVTGGASRMHFVKPSCATKFPKAKYIGSLEPEYSIAAGLAYWGRVDIRTQGFSHAVEEFAEKNIRSEVLENVGVLFTAIADRIAENTVELVKREFDGWKSRKYKTINDMKNGIDQKIKEWIDTKLDEEIRKCIVDAMGEIGGKLAEQITLLERQHGVPIGSLGTSFTPAGVGKIDIHIDPRHVPDYTNGIGTTLANTIGVVAGIMTGVVAYVVTPIVLGVVVGIIAAVSTTLASAILAILLSNPVGWGLLAAIGLVAWGAGSEAADKVKEKLPGWDLPGWVRNMVDANSIHQKIDNGRSEISNKVAEALDEKQDIRSKIVDAITETFKKRLREKADDARVLIG